MKGVFFVFHQFYLPVGGSVHITYTCATVSAARLANDEINTV
jgi:hypothetical protein